MGKTCTCMATATDVPTCFIVMRTKTSLADDSSVGIELMSSPVITFPTRNRPKSNQSTPLTLPEAYSIYLQFPLLSLSRQSFS